ncbi:MAG: protein translocase subunit SecF [Chloroflexi bacterium]|nr:protein translocase subunit SecF [Chloroflexota bacterium]
MIDFVRLRKWFYLLTAFLVVGSIIALIAPPRIPFGLEFTSGSSLTIDFEEAVDTEDVRNQLEAIGLADPVIQQTGDMSFFIRTEFVEEGLIPRLEERFGLVQTTSFEGATDLVTTVSFPNPVPAEELRVEFGQGQPDDLIIQTVTVGQIFVSSTDLSDELLATVFESWEERFGAFERTEFDAEGDLALTLDFGADVDPGAAATELRTSGLPPVIVVNLGDGAVRVAAKDYSQEDTDALITALTERFGEVEQTPFDYETGQMFTVAFTDPVTLDDVLTELAIFPATEAAGDQAVVQRAGLGLYLITEADLTPSQGEQLRSRLEQTLGPLDFTTFESADDLAITVDFGPAVNFQAFRVEATGRGLDDVVTQPFSATAFALVGEGIASEQRDDLFTRLEDRFGLAKATTFSDEGDMSVILDFGAPTEQSEIIAELQTQGIPELLVMQLTESRFFIGIVAVDSGAQDQLVTSLEQRFGPIVRTEFDHESGFAALLDYGQQVSLDILRRELRRQGIAGVLVTPGAGTTLTLAGTGFGAEAQEELIATLEEEFGLAKQTPFDFESAQLFTVAITDRDAAAKAVRRDLIVQDAGDQGIFLAANRLTSAQQESIFSALSEAYGALLQESFDFGRSIALNVSFIEQPVPEETLRRFLAEPGFGYTDLVIEPRGNGFFLRGTRPQDDQRSTIIRALEELAPVQRDTLEFSSVDAEIARRSILNTFWAVLAGTLGILVYVWWAFRRVSRPFRFGIAAILALVHDVLIVLGAFGVMAKFLNVEINSLMIVGILAIIGYSVNNTIVVFDRIRENVVRHPGRDFEVSVNVSLNETLSRNLNTSLTTTTAILAVILFGGPTIRDFMLVLLIGVLAGTYSSLLLAGNFLVSWEKGELRRLRLPFGPRRKPA